MLSLLRDSFQVIFKQIEHIIKYFDGEISGPISFKSIFYLCSSQAPSAIGPNFNRDFGSHLSLNKSSLVK